MQVIINCILYSVKEGKQGTTFFYVSVYLGSKGKFLYAVKVYAQGLNKD